MLFFALLLSVLMLIALYLDATRYTIPNWLNGMLIALYLPFIWMAPEPLAWLPAIGALFLVFLAGFPLFYFRIMGGGDIKMLCALALWCGFTPSLLEFLLLVGLFGGALSVGILIARPMVAYLAAVRDWRSLPRLFTEGADIPYGIAISTAFLGILWAGAIPGLGVRLSTLTAAL